MNWCGRNSSSNVIPALLVPKPTENNVGVRVTTKQKQMEGQSKLLDKNDLTGLWDWSLEDQKEVWDLIWEYASIFAMHDVGLGKTSLVKHSIRLMDDMPFKEHYRHILPCMYQEVHDHLMKMLEIDATRPSHSPWVMLI